MPAIPNMKHFNNIVVDGIQDTVIANDQMPDSSLNIFIFRSNGAPLGKAIELFYCRNHI